MDQILFFLFLNLILFTSCKGTTFTITNQCEHTIWPGILANAGRSELSSTGFELPSGGSQSFQASAGWSGRFWARTRCNFDPTTGQGRCATGDCGSGQVQCNGAGAIPPATLAEFSIGSGTGSGSSSEDYYDVSLVDGYNVPMLVDASGGSGSCFSTGCVADVNQQCPAELKAGDGDGCKSACDAFGTPEYCCSGAYNSPATCQATVYSQMFKTLCPRAYSYAYDDATSTFTCTGADYTITFCPTLTSQKSLTDSSPTNSSTTGETGTESMPKSGSGSGVGNSPVIVTGGDGSWLSNLISSGNSLTAYSNFGQQQELSSLIVSAASFVILHYLLCL